MLQQHHCAPPSCINMGAHLGKTVNPNSNNVHFSIYPCWFLCRSKSDSHSDAFPIIILVGKENFFFSIIIITQILIQTIQCVAFVDTVYTQAERNSHIAFPILCFLSWTQKLLLYALTRALSRRIVRIGTHTLRSSMNIVWKAVYKEEKILWCTFKHFYISGTTIFIHHRQTRM